MSATTEPGFEAYRIWASYQFSSAGLSLRQLWEAMEPHEQAMWDAIAQGAIQHAPPPAASVDAVPLSFEVVFPQAETKDLKTNTGMVERVVVRRDPPRVNITVAIPDVERYQKEIGRAALDGLRQAFVAPAGKRLRLQVVTDEQRQSEFQRTQPDGTVRELEEGEGTW